MRSITLEERAIEDAHGNAVGSTVVAVEHRPLAEMKLTHAQHRFLRAALRWTDDNEASGVGAAGPCLRMAERLQKRGLVEYVGHGTDIDGPGDGREQAIFAITDLGRSVLLPAIGEESK